MQESTPRLPRIDALDIARGIALFAMATYHFSWDLEFFGYLEQGTASHGPLKLYARCIASTFLFLVGVSLTLAHGEHIRWRPFWIRFAMVAGAAAAISVVTWFAVPNGFIFFGILHEIALASLFGLAFLRLPAPLTLAAAALVIALPHFARAPAFDQPWLWWLGLAPENPRSNDYVPILPWFGAVLAGIAATRIAARTGLLPKLAALRAGTWARPLRFCGRHSLAFYLIHQPLLIGAVWLFAQIMPAPVPSQQAQFTRSCAASCAETRDAAFCTGYCGCMLTRIESEKMLDSLFSGGATAAVNSRLEDFALQCSGEIDGLEGSTP